MERVSGESGLTDEKRCNLSSRIVQGRACHRKNGKLEDSKRGTAEVGLAGKKNLRRPPSVPSKARPTAICPSLMPLSCVAACQKTVDLLKPVLPNALRASGRRTGTKPILPVHGSTNRSQPKRSLMASSTTLMVAITICLSAMESSTVGRSSSVICSRNCSA